MNGFEHCCSYDTIQTVLRKRNRIGQSFDLTDNILDRPLKNMVFDNDQIDNEVIVSKPDCLNYYKLNRRPDSVKSSPIESTNSSSEFGSTDHRASCHRCGNMRKTILRCGNCPYVYCTRCSDKMREEHGFDIFENGCPVCKGVCCCGMNKTMDCNRMYHCYKKCPTTRSPLKRNYGHYHSPRSLRRCSSVKIEKSEEEEEELLDLSSCNEIPNSFTHTNRQTATCPYPWTSAYNSAPDESSGLKKATTHQKQNSYHETRPENPVTDYESVDKTKLKNILDDAMQSFSSILSPTSLMPEVNPFFLQCPLGSIGNIGHKVGKLPSIESLPYTKQGFYKDHNGILFPVDKPLHYYLPVFHDKEYSNPEDSFDLPLNEHVNNGSRVEEYSKIISKNNELIERLLQQENRSRSGTRADRPSTTVNNHSPPSTMCSVDPVQFCRDWLQHHGDAKEAHTPRTPSSNPSATSQLGKQFHYSLHKNGGTSKHTPEQKDPSSPIPFDSLFSDIPTTIPGTKYSQSDSIAAYMNLGIMTPGLTPMILSHITANETAYLENHGLMQEHLDDFLPEDIFACHTPATARDTSDGLRASDPFHFTPFLTSSSVDTTHAQQGRDGYEGTLSMSNIDCTPILNLNLNSDQLRGKERTSSLKRSTVEAHHDTLSTQPMNTTHATESSQFSLRGNPESLALICTELYTKILSDEIDCDAQKPRLENTSTRAAISEVGSEKIPDGRKQNDRNSKRKRNGRLDEDEEEEEKGGERGPLESFDDRIFEKDEPEYESTPQYQ